MPAKKKAVKKAAKKTTKKKAAKPAKKKSARKPNAKFMAPLNPSDTLEPIVGEKALPRTEATKKVWVYIKKKGLQDSKNRRMINCDDALSKVCGNKKQVSMFELTKWVSKHLKAI